jgi:D-alanyl-D-alanine carboxypeptidase
VIRARSVRFTLALALLLVACGTGQAREAAPSLAEPPDPPPIARSSRAAESAVEVVARSEPVRRPDQPPMAAGFRASLVADPCTDRDLPAPASSDELLTVLDRSYALPASYVPPDLVPAAEAGIGGSSGSKLVRAPMIDDLAALYAASLDAGLALVIESGYRSYANQAATFDSWASRLGHAEALRRSARPGHSEHQLGMAIDVTSPGWVGRFGDWGRETAEGTWLSAHAWEFGFVLSYPAGSEAETCFSYEPWHYRWIGRAAAAEHRASRLPLRTFLAGHAGD